MKAIIKTLLFGSVLLLSSLSLSAQEVDPWLDDTYLTQEDIAKQEAKEKAEAERRHKAYLKARRERELREQRRLEQYKRKQRERELDAYNGYTEPDEDELDYDYGGDEDNRYSDRKRRSSKRYGRSSNRRSVEIYGPYSARIHRFHGNGDIIIRGADDVYINGSYYGNEFDRSYSNIYIDSGWGRNYYYPAYTYSRFFDPFYSPWYGHLSYRYRPYYVYSSSSYIMSRLVWESYYDPFYSPWYGSSYYGGYYGAGYYGGYYGGYHDGYYHGRARRAYDNHYYGNKYRYGARSRSNYSRSRSSYGAYESARSSNRYNNSNNSYNRAYRGKARSSYNSGRYNSRSRSSYSRDRNYDHIGSSSSSRSRSYDRPRSSSSSSSSSSGSTYKSNTSRSSSSSIPVYRGRRPVRR